MRSKGGHFLLTANSYIFLIGLSCICLCGQGEYYITKSLWAAWLDYVRSGQQHGKYIRDFDKGGKWTFKIWDVRDQRWCHASCVSSYCSSRLFPCIIHWQWIILTYTINPPQKLKTSSRTFYILNNQTIKKRLRFLFVILNLPFPISSKLLETMEEPSILLPYLIFFSYHIFNLNSKLMP